MKVGIVGVGMSPMKQMTPDYSWKELMFDAAVKAYEDADINPRKEVDSFITCAEDYWEGFGIFDEFVPDQLGAALRPTCTITGDGIHGIACAYMQILSGLADVVAVEAHSKASDILSYEGIVSHALDPIYNKPLGGHPYYIAGLEMNAFLRDSRNTQRDCALVVEKNRINALFNNSAAYGARISFQDVLTSKKMFYPLKRMDISDLADGCIVLILASQNKARKLTDCPIWIRGLGWNSDTPWLENREWGRAVYAESAARMAYEMAKIKNPRREIDFAEVDDKFSYKELQHSEALGLCRKGESGELLREGVFHKDGKFPVNASGGSLGVGNLLEASGLHRVAEVALQLRQEAGRHQVEGEVALAQSWRGIPTASGGVVILGVKG